mgnify:CR=1 FL=1
MKKNYAAFALDFSPLIGLLGIVIFFGATLYFDGFLCPFIYLPTLSIVLGCALSVLLLCFPLNQVSFACSTALKTLFLLPTSEKHIAFAIMKASQIVHNSSLLSLQKQYLKQENHLTAFWREGLSLLIDGMSAEQAHQIMHNKMVCTYNRLINSANVFEKLANFVLAVGTIDALMILMSIKSIDFTDLLLPFLYGMILSCVFFRPLAWRIRQFAQINLSNDKLCLVGLKAVESAQNPRTTQTELNALLSPFHQINYFEG